MVHHSYIKIPDFIVHATVATDTRVLLLRGWLVILTEGLHECSITFKCDVHLPSVGVYIYAQ